MHIMVLHSSVTNRRIFANVFRKMGGIRVHVCREASELIDRMNHTVPDLLVIEKEFVYMKDGNFLAEVIQPKVDQDLAIMVAGYQFTKDEAVEVIRKGANELLLLPFNAEHLSEKVSRLLQQKVTF